MVSVLHIFVIIIVLLPVYTLAQNNGNITVGSSITAIESSNPWLSPSGDFAFGFQQLQNTSDLFLLSIWFNRIPERTIVWYVRGITPVTRGSTLQLDGTQGLVLRDPRGSSVWSTSGFVGEVSYGFMNDTGNFVLSGRNSSNLWGSFQNPSDTILPTQTLEINSMLVSRTTNTNFSQGKFYAQMLGNGNFVFNTRSVPSNIDPDSGSEYYNTQTSDAANSSNSGYQVLFNERGSIYIMRRNGQQTLLTPSSIIPPISDFYFRATLNFDGVFSLYYHSRNGSPGWINATSWPNNICAQAGSGACGYNNVCRLVNQRPVCECPPNYILADPNNPYGDCVPRFIMNCIDGANSSSGFQLLQMDDVDWPFGDYEQIRPSTVENCTNACLNDCLCGVAIFRDNSCWKKRLPLSNGRVDTGLNVQAFLKFRNGDVPILNPNSTGNSNKRNSLIIGGSILLGSSVFVNILFIAAFVIGFYIIRRKMTRTNENPSSGNIGSNLRYFTYKELVNSTDGFKEELGRGAFGIVYKGIIRDDSRSIVAVKRLDRGSQDTEKEFRAEVNAIGQTHHKNLVRLFGFCDDGTNRLLVYEFMSNGTLADFLFRNPKPSWSQRIQIALGVAGGLAYLHEECISQIIHCDIKPQNILLDESYNTRIADFGLAKLLLKTQSKTLTNIRGTKGYVAPEWFRNTQITAKVDVYSFGVLLLEIITCRRSLEEVESGDGEKIILTDWVWDCFQEGRFGNLVNDEKEPLSDWSVMERFVKVGIWCIQEDSSLRPSMRKACQMLEGFVEVEEPPCPYPFSITI